LVSVVISLSRANRQLPPAIRQAPPLSKNPLQAEMFAISLSGEKAKTVS